MAFRNSFLNSFTYRIYYFKTTLFSVTIFTSNFGDVEQNINYHHYIEEYYIHFPRL